MKTWHIVLIAAVVVVGYLWLKKNRAAQAARPVAPAPRPAVQSLSGAQILSGIAAFAAPFASAYNDYKIAQSTPEDLANSSSFDRSFLDQIPLVS